MGIARRIAVKLGVDSRVIRYTQPIREYLLDLLYSRSGLRRTVNGVPLRILPRSRALFVSDYDYRVAAFLRDRVEPGAICMSIGANIGVYALQFAVWSGPAGVVYAFEPNPMSASVLRRHVAINGLTGRVHIVECALADRVGTATLYAAGVDGMSRLEEPNPLIKDRSRPIIVELDTLDHFCDEQQIKPDVIMIDVEGFEIAVLSGARRLFATKHPPVTAVEIHPMFWTTAGADRTAMESLLAELNLIPVPLAGQLDPLGEHNHVALVPPAGNQPANG